MTDKGTTRADPAARATRAWQRMLSGRRLDLLDPSPKDIEIEDIAHGLARVVHSASSGSSTTTASGGSVRRSECSRP